VSGLGFGGEGWQRIRMLSLLAKGQGNNKQRMPLSARQGRAQAAG